MILLLGLVISVKGRGQVFGSLLKSMSEQVVRLTAYNLTQESGYSILEGGLTEIGGLDSEEYLRHADFYGSFNLVNGKIRAGPFLDEAETDWRWIEAAEKRSLAVSASSVWLSLEEKGYIQRWYDRLIVGENAARDEIRAVLSDALLKFGDGERLIQIGKIMDELHSYVMAAGEMEDRLSVLIRSRRKASLDLGSARDWYGIH